MRDRTKLRHIWRQRSFGINIFIVFLNSKVYYLSNNTKYVKIECKLVVLESLEVEKNDEVYQRATKNQFLTLKPPILSQLWHIIHQKMRNLIRSSIKISKKLLLKVFGTILAKNMIFWRSSANYSKSPVGRETRLERILIVHTQKRLKKYVSASADSKKLDFESNVWGRKIKFFDFFHLLTPNFSLNKQ